MKRFKNYTMIAAVFVFLLACDEEEMVITRVASPVVIDVADSNPNELTATVSELDKSGILDHTVGIVSIPVADLALEVFSGSTSLGTFTTDTSGKIIVTYAATKPNEFAGSYKGIAFRIKK